MKSKRRHIARPDFRIRAERDGKGGYLLWFEIGPPANAVTFSQTMEQWVALHFEASEAVALANRPKKKKA